MHFAVRFAVLAAIAAFCAGGVSAVANAKLNSLKGGTSGRPQVLVCDKEDDWSSRWHEEWRQIPLELDGKKVMSGPFMDAAKAADSWVTVEFDHYVFPYRLFKCAGFYAFLVKYKAETSVSGRKYPMPVGEVFFDPDIVKKLGVKLKNMKLMVDERNQLVFWAHAKEEVPLSKELSTTEAKRIQENAGCIARYRLKHQNTFLTLAKAYLTGLQDECMTVDMCSKSKANDAFAIGRDRWMIRDTRRTSQCTTLEKIDAALAEESKRKWAVFTLTMNVMKLAGAAIPFNPISIAEGIQKIIETTKDAIFDADTLINDAKEIYYNAYDDDEDDDTSDKKRIKIYPPVLLVQKEPSIAQRLTFENTLDVVAGMLKYVGNFCAQIQTTTPGSKGPNSREELCNRKSPTI